MTANLSVRDLEIITHWSGHDPAHVESDPRLLEMGRLLIHDGLTAVYNRRYFMARLQAELLEQQTVVVALLDLDGFKQVNDTLGHEGGDRVLQALAGLLRAGLPEAVVARLGGDEFALLFLGQPVESVNLTLERFVNSLPERWGELGLMTSLRFSAGIAAWPADASGSDDLVRAADRALYQAKRSISRAIVLARDLHPEMRSGAAGQPESALSVGQQPIWEAARRGLAEAEQGRGSLLLLRGPIGVGKSLLLEEVGEIAMQQGWHLLRAAPQGEYESYSVLGQLLAQSGRFRPVQRAANALDQMLRQQGKTCLLIDDLPDADLPSLFALRRLGATLQRRPVLIIATGSWEEQLPDGWAGFQAEGLAAGWLSYLEMGGLSREETGLLAARWLGAPLHPDALFALHRQADGNPVHAAALLQVWQGAGDLVLAADGWLLRPEAGQESGVPTSQILIRLIQQLPLEVRELVGLAAVLGPRLSRQTLGSLSGATGDELTDWIDRAVQARVFRTDGHRGLRFTHGMLREAAYSCLSPQTRRFAHRLVATMVEQERPLPAADLARHWTGAGQPARAFPHHVRAGEQALAAHDPIRARHHFQAAWRTLPISVGEAEYGLWYGRLALLLAEAARRNGDPRAAADLCSEVLAHRTGLNKEAVVRLLLELSESARQAGALTQAEEAQREAAALADDSLPAPLRLRTQVLELRLTYLKSARPEQIETGRRLAAESGALGQRVLQGELLTQTAVMLLQLGDRDEAVALNQRAIPLLPIGSGADASLARMRAGLLASSRAAARHWLGEALLAAAAVGETLPQARLLRVLGIFERGTGNWAAARRYFEQSMQLAGRQGSVVERDRTLHELGTLLVWSGQSAEEGIALIRSATEAALSRGDRFSAMSTQGRLAQVLLSLGRCSEALDALLAAREWLPPENLMAREQRIYRAEVYLRLGDLAAARAEMSGILDLPMVADATAFRGRVMGALLRAEGEPEAALGWLEQAVALQRNPFVEIHFTLQVHQERALCLRALGRVEEAARAERRVRQIQQRLRESGRNP